MAARLTLASQRVAAFTLFDRGYGWEDVKYKLSLDHATARRWFAEWQVFRKTS